MMSRAFAAIATASVLTACGAPADFTDASDTNFATALQDWYDAHPECVQLDRNASLPIERNIDDQTDRAAVEAAVAAGLLTAEPLDGSRIRYHPTEAGEEALREDDPFFGGVDICYARRQIESIESFTAPADGLGLRFSRVTYRYGLKDAPSWTSDPAIAAALPAIPEALEGDVFTESDNLVLTDQGWAHERSLQ